MFAKWLDMMAGSPAP